MSTSPMTCVVLQPKGTSRNAQLSAAVLAAAADHKPTAAAAAVVVRRATPPDAIGTWKWKDHTVHLFGYKTGKADTENKHELPPPHDKILLFGEAVLFATLNKTGVLTTFGTAEYTKFYNETLGGFDDIGSEDSDTDDEEDEEEEEEPAAEEEAAVEEEAAEESESEEEEEEEEEAEEAEEEAPAPRPVAKRVAAARGGGRATAASKRNAKKLPAWYSVPPLKAEPYLLQKTPAGGAGSSS